MSGQKADEAQRRGEADKQRSRDAGVVADKLDQDKGAVASAASSPGMTPTQREQHAQKPYQLQKVYAQKYIELSSYSETARSTPLPKLPSSNKQLMSYDTKPLREFQKAEYADGEQLLQKAQEARAAAAKLQQFAGVAQKRYLAMHSMPAIAQVAGAGLKAKAANPEIGKSGSTKSKESGGISEKIGKPGLNPGSTISRQVDSFKAGPVAKKNQNAEELARTKAGAQEKATPGEVDFALEAFSKMEKAKLLLAEKLAEGGAAEKQKSKTEVESFLDDVSNAAVGRNLASVTSPSAVGGSGETLEIKNAVAAIELPEESSLAAPEDLLMSESIFAQVSRQYRKRGKDLSTGTRTGSVMVGFDSKN